MTKASGCSQLLQKTLDTIILKGASGPIIAKYHLTLPEVGQREIDAIDKANAEHDKDNALYEKVADTDQPRQDELMAEMEQLNKEAMADLGKSLDINDEDQNRILVSIWKVAYQKEKDAETALK